ncbi:hypothetical protein [Mycetohabitans rhizoxinica]|uniref:hypothetical protein n=1 Tax=Mycetohabitans rhizoxinica TaxID=412963 RepID=UPI00138AF01A|nr:hypothetical protein [Mycetohabitans rhizoxinica]
MLNKQEAFSRFKVTLAMTHLMGSSLGEGWLGSVKCVTTLIGPLQRTYFTGKLKSY